MRAWLHDLGLKNLLDNKARRAVLVSGGSRTIDAIFGTSLLKPHGGGCMDEDEGIRSDHWLLWVDIPKQALFGSAELVKQYPKARRLKVGDPRTRKRYLQEFNRLAEEHNLYERAFKIEKANHWKLTGQEASELEAVINLRYSIMARAEQKCWRLCMGTIPWSPVFKDARTQLRHATLQARISSGRKVKRKLLYRVQVKTGKNFDANMEESRAK